MTGTFVSRMGADASASFICSAASCISGEWKAPETCNGTTRLAPATMSASEAFFTPSGVPEMTVWSGVFWFAGTTTSPACEISPQIFSMTALAVYSPSEWPAVQLDETPARAKNSYIAKLFTKSAGCVFSVCFSALSGPSNIIFFRSNPKISHASSKRCRTHVSAAYSSLPMPTACAPCPGKRKYIFMRLNPLYQQRCIGESSAKSGKHDMVALFDFSRLEAFVQGDGNCACRAIGVFVDRKPNFFLGNFKRTGDVIDHPVVGLVRHNAVEFFNRHLRPVAYPFYGIDHDPCDYFKDRVSVHFEIILRSERRILLKLVGGKPRPAAADCNKARMFAIGPKIGGKHAARLVGRGDHRRAYPVAEEHAGAPVGPVDKRGHGVAAND